MKLLFKQRIFSWFDSYDIYDEYGETAYTVKGQLSWGHKLVVYDRVGQTLGRVEQVILTFLPKFEIYDGDSCIGYIKKELTLFRPKYDIDFNGWHIEGDFFEWDYRIVDMHGFIIASISKDLFHLSDTYVIDVARPEDALYALMFVLAIDAEKCSRN